MTAACRRDSDGRPLLRTDPDAKNALGQPTGFDLKATNYHKPILHPDGLSGQRAGFIYAPVWVTPKADEDHWPSGDFVNCNGPNEGLPEWVQQGRDVSKEDLVVWHAFGLHHAARKPHDHCRRLSCILLKTGAILLVDRAGGLSRAERRQVRLQAHALRILRAQPRHRQYAHSPALPPLSDSHCPMTAWLR